MQPIEKVLQLFAEREAERATGKKGRILLQIKNGQLNFVDERKLGFFDWLFFDYKSCKLNEVVQFLLKQSPEKLEGLDEAFSLLDKKVEKHNSKPFSRKIFLNTPLHELFKTKISPPPPLPTDYSTVTEEIDTSVTSEVEVTSLKGGIRNPINACYMNSVLQALRFCPSFTEFLDTSAAKSALLEPLKKIYERLNKGETVEDIQKFRVLANQLGWPSANELREGDDPLTCQLDAAEFYRYLSDLLQFPEFLYTTKVHYEFPIPVRSLDRLDGHTVNHIALPMSEAPAGSTLADIALQYRCREEVEKSAIVNADGFIPTRRQWKILEKMPAKQQIPALHTIEFTEGVAMPNLVPLILPRYTNAGEKITTSIPVSEHIDFPLTEQKKKFARYRLVAAVVHTGGKTINSGHYYTYVPHKVGDETVWHEYNDSFVAARHKSDWILQNIATNGYLFFYEFDHFVDAKGQEFPLKKS